MANWLMVMSEDSFNASRKAGVLGFYADSRGMKMLNRTSMGDKLVFYITGKKVIRGLAAVAGEPYQDNQRIYGDHRDEDWSLKVKLKVLDTEHEADMEFVRWDLDFIKDKALPYSCYLVNTLIPLTDHDLNVIQDAQKAPKKAGSAK